MATDPLIPTQTPFNYNIGINYESWENGRVGYSITADLNQITQYFGLIKTYHDVAVGTSTPTVPVIDPTQQSVISYVVATPNVQLVMGTVNSALAQGGFGLPWTAGLMTSSTYTDSWVQMIIGAFGSAQAVQDHLKMILLGNEVDANGPPPGDPSFGSYQTWIDQSFSNLKASLAKYNLGSIPVSTTIANYGSTNSVAVATTSYIQQNWSSGWNGGVPTVLFNQYTQATSNGPASSTDYQPVINYFDSLGTTFSGTLEPFIGETGYSSFYGQPNQVSVYSQISSWLNGEYAVGGLTVPLFMFDAFDQPSQSPPYEVNYGIFAQTSSFQPAGLKAGLSLPSWSNTPSATARSDFYGNFRSDILTTAVGGGVSVWDMSGALVDSQSAVTSGGAPAALGPTSRILGAGDFTGDGRADLLVGDAAGGLTLWEMNGSTVLAALPLSQDGTPAAAGASWSVAGIADLNRDGKADILWQTGSGALTEWLMDGAQVTASATIMQGGVAANPGRSWSVAGAADTDGDRRPEVLWRSSGGAVGLWSLDANRLSAYDTVMQGRSAANPGTSWQIAGTGDFNGDRQADLLWRGSSGEVGIWELDGTQLVAYAQVTRAGAPVVLGSAWQIAGTADYSGDGRTDILWSGPGGQLVVWTMDEFQLQASQTVTDGTNPVLLGAGMQIAPTT
ncbi:MAG: VCBS repeat-containing protein [Reyranellaceae bacterium]